MTALSCVTQRPYRTYVGKVPAVGPNSCETADICTYIRVSPEPHHYRKHPDATVSNAWRLLRNKKVWRHQQNKGLALPPLRRTPSGRTASARRSEKPGASGGVSEAYSAMSTGSEYMCGCLYRLSGFSHAPPLSARPGPTTPPRRTRSTSPSALPPLLCRQRKGPLVCCELPDPSNKRASPTHGLFQPVDPPCKASASRTRYPISGDGGRADEKKEKRKKDLKNTLPPVFTIVL